MVEFVGSSRVNCLEILESIYSTICGVRFTYWPSSDRFLTDNIHKGRFCLALSFSCTEQLKTALCAETRAWCVAFGRNCNFRYRTEMEEMFTFIEDITKRLSRPIKDLDDIRHAMAALKEIRDREIMIDMSIGPIEVSAIGSKKTSKPDGPWCITKNFNDLVEPQRNFRMRFVSDPRLL